MNYNSDFSSDISEYVYQQIEEIKSVVSDEASFLLEETSATSIVLKVKDKDVLYKVESSADSFIDAVFMAKEKIIEMILSRQDSKVRSYRFEEKRINN